MKWRWLFLCLFLLFFLTFMGQAAGAQGFSDPGFQDIEGSFARQDIVELAGQGIISGLSPAQFGPGEKISRGHFCQLLARVLGIQPVFPDQPAFSDLPRDSAGAGYLEALAGLGILTGTGNNGADADKPVTRQDAALLLYRALAEKTDPASLEGRFADESQVSPYAVEGVAFITRQGLMAGFDGCFHPQRELTRAEAAVLAGRLLKTRQGQALTALPVISPQYLEICTGETRKIESGAVRRKPAFTVAWGLDDPGAGRFAPGGFFTAGQRAGKVTITVNAGSAAFPVYAEIKGCQAAENSPGASTGMAQKEEEVEELAREAACRVVPQEPDAGFQEREYRLYAGPVEGLTSSDETWTGFLRQGGRDIIIDLKEFRPVTQVSLEFKQDAGSGVFIPEYLQGEVSPDGVLWYQLGQVRHGVEPFEPAVSSRNLTLTFPPVTTRYLKLSFPVEVWVFARNLSVKGYPGGTEQPAVLAMANYRHRQAAVQATEQDAGDILLVYTGSGSGEDTWSVLDFLPVVAYQDVSGKLSGRMFDTLLFLPYHGIPATRASWEAYLEDLFAPGKQLPALEEAVAKVNGVDGLQGKKKVILTVPYPDEKEKAFGSLEEGKSVLSFSEEDAGREQALENRFAAVRWYYNKMMERWREAGFKHLELDGIYWYKEYMDQTISGEKELVQNVARLVRGRGQNFYWIPFYGAQGYEEWRSYGFTHVFLQPNYYAVEDQPEERMDRAVELARRYKTGIELEYDEKVLSNRYFYDLFYKQLNRAHQLGLDGEDETNAYFAGLKKALLDAASSKSPSIRAVYDDFYRWISGTYTPDREVP